MAERKRRLREQLRSARRRLAPVTIRAAGRALVGHWERVPALVSARRVALYASLPDELPTRPLFERLRCRGCEVLLPRCGAHALVFARVDAWADLVPGPLGVLEPPERLGEAALGPHEPVLVPGLAFDLTGNRLGQGKAWYDRSFEEADTPRLIGAGFALQVVATVPSDSWDRRVGAILTERGYTSVVRGG